MFKLKTKTITWANIFLVLFAYLFFFVNEGAAQTAGKEELVQENRPLDIDKEQGIKAPAVQYIIDARLFPGKNKLEATGILTWVNKTSVPADRLMFHLYYNAFNGPQSTYLQEKKFYRKSPQQLARIRFGGIDIENLEVIGGENLVGKMQFVSPDDGNPQDKTVMQVSLEKPVLPLHKISLKFKYNLRIPQIFHRTGRAGNYFFFGQWFPKLGVWQETVNIEGNDTGEKGEKKKKKGAWHCHQHHAYGEFFADYGTYKVSLTVPSEYLVGATGNLVKSEKHTTGANGNSETVTYFYEEENIHDFAWTTSPNFQRLEKKIKLEGNEDETTIELLLSPHHDGSAEQYLQFLTFAMDYSARKIFPYPYKKITLVDPPLDGILSGGMEYPTLISCGYIPFVPSSIEMIEHTVAHEFSHIYWYGLVGNDETREAWLDEGLATFFQGEIQDHYFGDTPSFLDASYLVIDDWEMTRAQYLSRSLVDPVNQYSWKFLNNSEYIKNAYAKTGLLLRSLKNTIGEQKFYEFLQAYTKEYRWQHPRGTDFIRSFNQFMGEDYSWVFEQFIDSPRGLDHAVYSVESVKIPCDSVTGTPGLEKKGNNQSCYRNTVVFTRNEGYFPVELLIRLENGQSITATWSTKERWKRFVFTNESPIDFAAIDPGCKIVLDTNLINNTKKRKPNHNGINKLACKAGFFFQDVLSAIIF